MKLIAIEIVGFGKWQQQKIEFLPNNQLLFGANEAGKSTIYQFIQAMLFGFPPKGKRKKDYQPKNGGAYGGRLWFSHPVHGEVQVERFKGQNKGQAKVYFNDRMGDEAVLKKLLHPLSKELFQSVFSIQQEQLGQLDKLTEEELQTSLLSLGLSGSQQLLVRRDEYFKMSQTVYKGKGSQPPLNQKLMQYQELQQRINDKEQQERPFQEIVTSLANTEQQISEQYLLIQQIKDELTLVEKQVMNLPLYEELQSIDELSEAPVINLEDQEKLLSLYQQHRFLYEELIRLNQNLAVQSDHGDQQEEYQFYLEEEENIKRLLNQRYAIDKLLSEIQWMTQNLEQNQKEMQPLERQWGWSKQNPPQFALDEQEVNELRESIVERTVKLQNTQTDLHLLEEEIATREENLSTFETVNKNMFQKGRQSKGKSVNLAFCLLGAALLILSFFFSAPLRYVGVGISVVAILIGVAPLFYQPTEAYKNEKRQWQEKLSQLDYLNDQLLKLKADMKKIHEEERELANFIAEKVEENHLGRMDQVEFWLNHRSDITRYLILINTNEELEQQLLEDQKRMAEIAQETERFTARLSISGTPLAQRIQIISRFVDQMEKIRFEQEYQADAYTRQTIREVKEKQQQIDEQLTPLLHRFQIDSINRIPDKLKSYQNTTTNKKRKKELQSMLAGLYTDTTVIKELPVSRQNLAKKVKEAEEQLLQLQKIEQKLLYQRKQMLSDGTLDELYQEQAALKAEVEELALEWSGYQLAGQLLMDLLTELSEKQLPNLLNKIAEYIQLLTEQAYQSIQLEAEQLIVIRQDHQRFLLHELSTGTKDQVIMAVRFAFLYLQKHRSLCPIMIDDGWLHYDSQRKKQLAELFALFSEQQQVICFSSDKEMVSYYQELKQPIIELKGV